MITVIRCYFFFSKQNKIEFAGQAQEHKTLKEAVVDTNYTHYNIYKHYRKVFNLSRCLIFLSNGGLGVTNPSPPDFFDPDT